MVVGAKRADVLLARGAASRDMADAGWQSGAILGDGQTPAR
jgi:hypothetical protein